MANGIPMDEDTLNELYMRLQGNTLPGITDNYDLMQSTPAIQDNAHSAIDIKMIENDLSDIVKNVQNMQMGTITQVPTAKHGLGAAELFSLGGAAAGYGAVKMMPYLKSLFKKISKSSAWKNIPTASPSQISTIPKSSPNLPSQNLPPVEPFNKSSLAMLERWKNLPPFMKTGDYAEKLSKYGNIPGTRMPKIPGAIQREGIKRKEIDMALKEVFNRNPKSFGSPQGRPLQKGQKWSKPKTGIRVKPAVAGEQTQMPFMKEPNPFLDALRRLQAQRRKK